MSDWTLEAYCGGLFQTNGYLLANGGDAWLFDAPEGVADWLDSLGVRPAALYLTHQHHDHVVGAGEVQDRFEIPILAYDEPSDELTLASRLEAMTGVPCTLDPYRVDERLEAGADFELGGLAVDVLHIPGHSPDSLVFSIAALELLVGGDVLFCGSIGRTDFPHGDHGLLLSGIREKLWPLPDATRVLPGHGPATTIGIEKASNPYLS
jgi:hydroxyacylglutathione hydrolase